MVAEQAHRMVAAQAGRRIADWPYAQRRRRRPRRCRRPPPPWSGPPSASAAASPPALPFPLNPPNPAQQTYRQAAPISEFQGAR
eukprot:2264072-Rhodomonas_salina.1